LSAVVVVAVEVGRGSLGGSKGTGVWMERTTLLENVSGCATSSG